MNRKFYKVLAAFGMLLAFAAVIFQSSKTAEAAKIPEVRWAEELLLVSDVTNDLLVTHGDAALKGYKAQIAKALSAKLYAERNAGKLPFTLDESESTYEYEGFYDDASGAVETKIALIPLSIMADALHTEYKVQDKTFYKSIVVGSLYIAICKSGTTANNWTMVGGIPLSGYTILGDDVKNPLTTPPTKKEEADAYVAAMTKLINEQLTFGDLKQHLQNLNAKKIPNTYEVMEVGLTSKRAPEIFGAQSGKIQAILGTFYTARFQETSKAVVYPPIAMIGKNTGGDMSSVGNKSAADDVSDTLFSLTGGKSTSGATMTLSMPEPTHKINLAFDGAGWKELQGKKESDVVKNMGYGARLSMNINGDGAKSVDDFKQVQYIIPSSGSIDELQAKQLPDIYTALLIRLADRLASGKK